MYGQILNKFQGYPGLSFRGTRNLPGSNSKAENLNHYPADASLSLSMTSASK